jgi:hypothetical protein
MDYKKIKVELGNIKRGGAVTDEQIANALNEYFAKNPVKDGESGGYYKPIMFADGTLMFVPTKDDMDAVGSVGNVKGKDGYTPQKGVDYFDGVAGYTPQKGIDYFDGKDGDKGDNGGYYRPHLTPEGHLVFTASEEGMLEVGDLGRIKGTDGRGIATIERINGTGLPGTTDTYKITFTDESAFTFDVYNGKDGADDAPPDYEQNDSAALDYIKNRPFYSVKTEIYTDRAKAQKLNGISVSFNLEVGKVYDVTINGTVYSCVCEQSTYNDSEANKLTCGNYAIYVANRTLYFTYPYGEDNLTINITIVLEDIKKIDEKYLPENIGGGVGKDGKSAYEYAKEAGYEGTEEEFAEKLAVNPDWVATKKVDGGEETYISQQTLSSGMWSKLQMNFQVGITYDVYFNGEIYPCVAGNEDGGIYLGNITLMESASPKPHNNEPFCIYWAGAGATGGFFYKASTVSYPITLKVTSHADAVYNKMPKEYLPEGVAFKSNIPEGGATSWNDLEDKPFYTYDGKAVFSKTLENSDGTFMTEPPEGFELIDGKYYTITLNSSVIYTSVCKMISMDGVMTYVLGDFDFVNGLTGDFAFVYAPSEGMIAAMFTGMEDYLALQCRITETEIKPLDDMFLPESVKKLEFTATYFADIGVENAEMDIVPVLIMEAVERGVDVVCHTTLDVDGVETKFEMPLTSVRKESSNTVYYFSAPLFDGRLAKFEIPIYDNGFSFGGTLSITNPIPTDDHINSLIDAKLGVIENGSY